MSELKGHRVLKGKLVCVSGVRIGGSKESLEIGGTDNPILRHPISRLPYVPGSSLKGKIRSLLEQKYRAEKVMGNGKPCDCGTCKVCIIFGCAAARNTQTVTRVICRDCHLSAESLKTLEDAREELGLFYSEAKSEVVIDRKTGKAAGTGPRVQERIPAGTKLDFEIVLRVFEGDPVEEYVNFIREGIALLENDTLGGSGTRGYGKVKIEDLKIEDAATGGK